MNFDPADCRLFSPGIRTGVPGWMVHPQARIFPGMIHAACRPAVQPEVQSAVLQERRSCESCRLARALLVFSNGDGFRVCSHLDRSRMSEDDGLAASSLACSSPEAKGFHTFFNPLRRAAKAKKKKQQRVPNATLVHSMFTIEICAYLA